MDKLTHYRKLVKNHLSEIVAISQKNPASGVETLVAFDEERDHYLLLTVGWQPRRRQLGMPLFVRLVDGKIWIEQDGTEEGIGNALVRAGVPEEDIVLAFLEPKAGPPTEAAAAH